MPLLSRGSAIGLTALAISQGTTLIVEAGIVRILGPASLGAFAVGASIVAIFAITIVAGCVVAVGRMVAAADAIGDRSAARRYVLLGLLAAIGSAAPIAVLLLLLRTQIGGLLGGSTEVGDVVGIFALSLPLQAVGGVALAASRALNRLYPDLLYLCADAAVRLSAIPALAFAGADVRQVAALHVVAAFIALPLALGPLRRFLLEHEVGLSGGHLRLREFGGLIAGQTVGSAIWAAARRCDTLAVASLAGPAAAGGYRIAVLIASTGAVLQSAAQPILVPVSTRDFIGGGAQALLVRFRMVARLTLLVSAPVFAVCLAGRREIAEAFAQSGAGVEAPLVVLCFGFALDCAAGPGTSVLVVSGRSWRATANIALAFVVEVALLVFLVPQFGPAGAAVSLGLAFMVVEALQLWSIRRGVGRPVFDLALGRAASLAAVLLVAALVIGSTPASWTKLAALCAALAVYVWSTIRFAVSRDEFFAVARVRPSVATQ